MTAAFLIVIMLAMRTFVPKTFEAGPLSGEKDQNNFSVDEFIFYTIVPSRIE